MPPTPPDRHHDQFVTIWRANRDKLIGYLRKYSLKRLSFEDAVDIAQEAAAQLYARFATVEHPRAYLYKTATRLANERITHLKDQTSLDQLLASGRDFAERPALDSTSRILETYSATLEAALGQLNPGHRALLLVLAEDPSCSTAELADMVGYSRATVRVHKHRALARMKRLMASHYGAAATAQADRRLA